MDLLWKGRSLRAAPRHLGQAIRRDLQWDVQMGGSAGAKGPSFVGLFSARLKAVP
jgi:hypothetical protein